MHSLAVGHQSSADVMPDFELELDVADHGLQLLIHRGVRQIAGYTLDD